MNIETYDTIIIGVGQAGNPLTTALVEAGWKTAVIERRYVGGTCINDGCTPTKTMIASGRVAYLAQRAADYGVHTGPVHSNLAQIQERKQAIVESFRDNIRRRIEKLDGADLVDGEARFVGPKTVEVSLTEGGTRTLTAATIFINTGGRPTNPPIPGLGSVPTLNSTTMMELDTLPEHLLVLGGGYIGLEFGQLFRRLGSQVTIIQRGPQLLAREDSDIAEKLTEILREDGITVHLEADTVQVGQEDNGRICLTLRTPDGEQVVSGSHLLVATGRKPNTEALNLPAAGVATDNGGYISVNERLETNVPGIYALGDVKGGPAFTHISYDDYRIVRDNLLQGGARTVNGRFVPYVLYTDPQLGRVGFSEREARTQGYNVRVASIPMNYVARAIEVDETRGLMKAVIDDDTNQILGCAVLGIEGGELMSMLQIAMMGQLPYTTLREGIFAHPTLAESLNTLFAALEE